MRGRLALLGLAFAALVSPIHAITVFACEPEWAALVRILAPEASIVVATGPGQDPHQIEARPSLIAALRRADLAVCTGAGLEAGWLPVLQARAGNPRVQDGRPGMIYMATLTTLVDARLAARTPFEGDVHPEGNPHFHLDPERLGALAQGLAAAISRWEPGLSDSVSRRARDFAERWQQRVASWRRRLPDTPVRIVVQHGSFTYFFRWAGVEVVADLEPKPGVPPTASHLNRVLGEVRSRPPHAVWIASYQDARPAQWLRGQLPEIEVVVEPASPSTDADERALVAYFDRLVERVVALSLRRATPSIR